MRPTGLHHLTVITARAPNNLAFYTRVLGSRLVRALLDEVEIGSSSRNATQQRLRAASDGKAIGCSSKTTVNRDDRQRLPPVLRRRPRLALPPLLELRRAEIEAGLKPL